MAEARGFEPRMGANPNRISSPFATAKAPAGHPRLTESAQVSGAARIRRRNPAQPDARPAGPSMAQQTPDCLGLRLPGYLGLAGRSRAARSRRLLRTSQ